jgi:sulfide:quinone oxidoreductase
MFTTALLRSRRHAAKLVVLPAEALISVPLVVSWCWVDDDDDDATHEEKHRIVIVGGGTAGIGIAAQLRIKGEKDVLLVEPSPTHYYQPLWTLVGGGLRNNTQSTKPTKDVIPEGVQWMQDAASKIDPETNTIQTKKGKTIKYDYLVVATGMEAHFDRVPGLQETIGKNGVVSIYDYRLSQTTQEVLKNVKQGKCGGAPQKIMYLAEDNARFRGYRDQVEVQWVSPQPTMFAIPKYAEILQQHCDERGIERHHGLKLVHVDGPHRVATFEQVLVPDGGKAQRVAMHFDVLHVIPFLMPPRAVRESKLAAPRSGFVSVNVQTLQNNTGYPNVFAAGDAADLPTSKTMAAITKQAPILVHNLLAYDRGDALTAEYDGYTSCPLVMGRHTVLLAEFKYGGELAETFVGWQDKPRVVFMFMKQTVFPLVYWTAFLKGRWFGPSMFQHPKFPENTKK